MLELIDTGMPHVVGFRIAGKINAEDMTTVLDAAREAGQRVPELGLYEEIESVGGIEINAIVQKLSYFHETGISNIRKIAVVSDKRWIQTVVGLEDKVIPFIQMRCYPTEQRNNALSFLKTL